MKRIAIVVAAALALGGCAPQSRVEDLETRVMELEDLVNEMATLIGTGSAPDRITSDRVVIPSKQCARPGIAVWEEDGKLGCTGPNNLNHIEGYDLYFPATKGCIGAYVIMGPESLTCDTPEHPYH